MGRIKSNRRSFFKISSLGILGTMVFPLFLKSNTNIISKNGKHQSINNGQMKMNRPYILAESYWKEVKNTDFELALLP